MLMRVSKALACAVFVAVVARLVVVVVCSDVLFFSDWATDKIARKLTIYWCVRWVRCNCRRILFTRDWDWAAAAAAYTTITLINISIVNRFVCCSFECSYLPAKSLFSIVCLPACMTEWRMDGLDAQLFDCLRSACELVCTDGHDVCFLLHAAFSPIPSTELVFCCNYFIALQCD